MLRDVFEAKKTPETAAVPRPLFTLYVMRPVMNPQAIVNWMGEAGLPADAVHDPTDWHITIAYSSAEVDWSRLTPRHDVLQLPDQHWSPTTFGEVHVLLAERAPALHTRWQEFRDAGASYDFPEYNPHITVSKTNYPNWNDVGRFRGDIILGPECFNLVHTG